MPSFTSNVQLRAGVFLLAYALTAALGRITAPENGPFALVWPAAGVALVWLLWAPTIRHRVAAAAAIAFTWAVVGLPSDLATGPLLVGALSHAGFALVTSRLFRAMGD